MSLNLNQVSMTPVLGMASGRINPNVRPCIISPESTYENFRPGTPVKRVAGTGPGTFVDACPVDETPFGVIPYNAKKSSWAAGDAVAIYAQLSVIFLKASEDIDCGQELAFDMETTGEPTVSVLTTGKARLGIADSQGAGGSYFAVEIDPAALVTS